MNIAIADDRAEDLQQSRDYLLAYISDWHPELLESLSIKTFSSAEAFLEDFEPGRFDLLLLDIYMEEMTGMEAAEAVRLRDEKVPIIFLTTSSEHLMEGYRVFAAGYLLKPLAGHKGDFERVLDHVFKGLLLRERSVSVPLGGRELNVPLRRLMYADINAAHKLCLHLPEEVVDTTLPYARLLELLAGDERFTECHHRIIINMDYVRHMEENEFIMEDGSRLPISKRRLKEAKLAYMEYIAQR